MAKPFVHYDQNDKLSWTSPLDFLVDLLRWALIFGVTLAVMALLVNELGERPGHTAFEISEGRIFETTSSEPPPLDADGWQPVSLPDDWRYTPRKGLENAWYQFDLAVNRVDKQLWAAFLPTVIMNSALYINGELVGSGGQFERPMSRSWNRPLYFTLPRSLLVEGNNKILVRLASVPTGSGLISPLYFGPHAELKPYYDNRYALKITIPIVASIATGLLAIATLLIYYSRRDQPVYRWYGIGTLVWSVHNIYLFVIDPPLPNVVWDWFWYVTLGWFIVMIPPYVHGLLGYERPKIERALFAYAFLGSLAMTGFAFYDHVTMDVIARRVWTVSWLAIGLYPTFMMIHAVWRSRDIEVQWLLTAAMLIFVLGLRDCIMSNGLISRVDGYLMHYSIPMVIAVFGWLLLSRFVTSIGEAETLNKELHLRVAQRTAELENSFKHASQLERERAIQTERERILRDMHDGVGGHLVAAVAMAESGEISSDELAESLRDTLDELRLTIDSLDLEQGDLSSALGTLRARLTPAFAGNSPSLSWEMDILPDTPGLGPEVLTHIVRIVREAVSNAIRHAKADQIWVRIRPDQSTGKIRIEVEDNGQGIKDLDHAGHGLTNMRHRAEAIGANIEILSSNAGTRIVLILKA